MGGDVYLILLARPLSPSRPSTQDWTLGNGQKNSGSHLSLLDESWCCTLLAFWWALLVPIPFLLQEGVGIPLLPLRKFFFLRCALRIQNRRTAHPTCICQTLIYICNVMNYL